MAGVRSARGTSSIRYFRSTATSPTRSASPMPIIPTRTIPSGGNSMKFFTRFFSSQ